MSLETETSSVSAEHLQSSKVFNVIWRSDNTAYNPWELVRRVGGKVASEQKIDTQGQGQIMLALEIPDTQQAKEVVRGFLENQPVGQLQYKNNWPNDPALLSWAGLKVETVLNQDGKNFYYQIVTDEPNKLSS